jgi:hypothetical protein
LEGDIPEYQNMLMEGREPEDLNTIFPPVSVIAFNPDKSIKESFIDMVADYK